MALKQIPNSIVFNSDDPDFLNRTPGAPTDATTWTLSFWVKRGIGDFDVTSDTILAAGTSATDNTQIFFSANGGLFFRHEVASAVVDNVSTQSHFLTDPTTWYHVVIVYDSNEVLATDRIKFWVNNIKVESFNGSNFPTLAATSFINTAVEHRFGDPIDTAVSDPSRGYLADVYFVDGLALTPTTFGEQIDDSWQAIVASPTFGANGFLLEFADDLELGDDTSGNVNDWTENSITAVNQREDSPSQNHVTLNPLRIGENGFPDPDLHFGSRQFIATAVNINACWATASLPLTGKYYWEVNVDVGAVDETRIGIVTQHSDVQLTQNIGTDNFSWAIRNSSGTVLELIHDGLIDLTFSDTGTVQSGDYVQIAFDSDTGNLWFGVNGTFLDSGNPAAGTLPTKTLTANEIAGGIIPAVAVGGAISNQVTFRAGTEDLEGVVPTGFVTLRVDAWPTVAITKPSDHFEVIEWAGDNASPRAIAGADFQPDLVWLKNADSVGRHLISDIIKGAGTVHYNHAAIADDAASLDGEISVFETDGISVQDGGTTGQDVNASGREYLALLWKESVLAGLDLVGYVGAAAPQNVAHGLGVAPDFMYVRNRDTAAGNEIYHGKIVDASGEPIFDPETDSFQADTTAAVADSAAPWDDTAPDASNFRVGSATSTNVNTDNHAAYLWAEVEGFTKVGSYTGGGTAGNQTNAPFIYCGFRPKAVLIKRIPNIEDWALFVRDGEFSFFATDQRAYLTASRFLRSNLAQGNTGSTPGLIICGSGFGIRQADAEFNQPAAEYIFIAFAEVPFKHASASASAPKNADGAIDLKFQIDATGDDPNQFGDGQPDLGIQIDATGDLPNQHGAGAIDLAIVIDGQGTNVNRHGAGAIDLAFVIDATADYVGEFGDGAKDLALTIDAAGLNPGKHGDGLIFMSTEIFSAAESGDDGGSIPLPALQAEGTIVSSFPLAGEARIPQLQLEAILDNANTGFGPNILLPKLQTQGEINGSAGATLPLLQVLGTMVPGRTYVGTAITIPFLQVEGSGISPQPIAGNVRLPGLRTFGSILSGAIITENELGGLVLPQLQVEGFLFIPNLGTGSVLLPALNIDPLSFIAAGSIGGGSVTLPFVRVEGIIVNGVALTSTVWVMNTETFETTNYLNFDFDSLVSFNEQPYGVTSSGIFLLEGDDDDGTNIDARILTGISDRGDENLKEVAHLYAQGEFQALILQLFPDGQTRIREYELTRVSNSTGIIHARAKGARGLRSRSWQMGFRNSSGGDFTIDKLGLLIRKLVRKTRKN
jgi:hypothetical protein